MAALLTITGLTIWGTFAKPQQAPAKPSPYSELETRMFKKARAATFKVVAERPDPETGINYGWSGTAFLAKIDNRLVIVTAGHVCHDKGDYVLELGEDDAFSANVVAVSNTTDTCFMTVSPRMQMMDYYELKTERVRYGKQLAAIGHANGGRLTQYVITATGDMTIEISDHVRTFLSARGEIYPGQSGGPVIDPDDGLVVALNSATGPHIAFVTTSKDIVNEFRRLVAKKKKRKPRAS